MATTHRPGDMNYPPDDPDRYAPPGGPDRYPDDPTQPVEPDASLGDLLNRLTQDFSGLVSTQVELAKVEIKEEVTTAGRAAGLLGGGTVCAYMALVLLSFAAAWGLSELVPEGVAFLIVGLAYAAAAAVLLPKGKEKLSGVNLGEHTTTTVKEDVRWAREQMS
jgi:uncharacterized membrane protein YqjE